MITTFIYGLKDPRTNEIRYVGKSNKPKSRYSAHLKKAPIAKTKCYCWINSLLKLNLKPTLVILEEVLETEWGVKEDYWISQFDNLTNLIDGGKFCPMLVPEIVEKMKLTRKLNNKPVSQETRDKLRITTTNSWKKGLMPKNFKHSEKTKEKKKIIQKEIWNKRDEKERKLIGEKISRGKYKKLKQYDLNMNFIKEWNSVKEAELFYSNYHKGQIKVAIRNKKSWKKFYWEYIPKNETFDPSTEEILRNDSIDN
jgi:hypothetical protein